MCISCTSGNSQRFWKVKIRINLRIGPGDSEALRRNVRAVWSGPRDDLTRRAFGETDLADAMAIDHAADFTGEEALVERLLTEKTFEKGAVLLDAAEAEALLRACAAIRLALRGGPLSVVPDESLETGVADAWLQDAERREGFACYIFFAALQEHLIHALDPGLHEGLADLSGGEDGVDAEESSEPD